MENWRTKLKAFLFPAETDDWLVILRIGLGLEIVLYCLSLAPDWNHLFAGHGNGLISRDVTEAVLNVESRYIPRLGWLVDLGESAGLKEQTILSSTWALLFGSGCLLIVGFCCRTAAITAWFLHLCAVKSGDFMTYGIDNFTTIGLIYLIIAPLPDRLALDTKIWKPLPPSPDRLGFSRRILQIHVCFIYFFSGLTKCLGAGWWNGATLWRALTRAPFNVISPDVLISWQFVLPAVGVLVCLTETTYPIFIWPKKTRFIWLMGVLTMHLGIALLMGLQLFALIMVVLNLAAFAPPFHSFRRCAALASSAKNESCPAH